MIRAGIDIGAHSLRLVLEEEGLVFDEPAYAAFNSKGDILAIGEKALELRGKGNDEIRVVTPINNGEVDFEVLEAMLNELCYEFRLFRLFQKTVLLICYPTVLDEALIEKLKDSLLALGAWEIYFDQEIWITAIGSGLDLYLPVAASVMNVGSSNCDIAAFELGKMTSRKSNLKINGEAIADRIGQYLANTHQMIVSPYTIDQIVQTIGNVRIRPEPLGMEIRGVNAANGMVSTIVLNENDMEGILLPIARELGEWVSGFLDELPEKTAQDIRERGIIASGGVMKIKGLTDLISAIANCPVYVTDEPDHTAAQGLHALLANLRK